MNDPKELIDGLFNSMIGDEPEADQPETAECHNCADTFLAETASEDGWCEECVEALADSYSDTVGAPIIRTVAEMDDVAGCLVDSDQYRAFAAEFPELAEKSRLARQEVSDWNERRAKEAVAFQVGGSKHDPNPLAVPDFQVEAYKVASEDPPEPMTYSQGDEPEFPSRPPASAAVEHLEDLVDNLEAQSRELTQRVEALESRLDSLINGFADATHSLR